MYNRGLVARWNKFCRKIFIIPKMKEQAKRENFGDITVLSNNCLGGLLLHDFGIRFNTPTINLFFQGLDFFYFVENLEHYLSVDICPCLSPRYQPETNYPIMTLPGDKTFPDLELHFLHYHSTEEAIETWCKRKERVNYKKLFVTWTFSFDSYDEDVLFPRFEALPVKNKIAFVNHPVDNNVYPHIFYLKGFEGQDSLGQILNYCNMFGGKYYDQFDWTSWFGQR